MNLKEVGLVACSLIIGAVVGNTLSGSKLDGRLSACKDMTSVINQALPFGMTCEIIKGDVYISTLAKPEFKISLDGKTLIPTGK